MWRDINKLTIRLFIALTPVFLLVATYIYLDPFRVVHPSHPYFSASDPMYVGWNKSFVSTFTYNHNHQQKHFDSYIFGSSLSIGYTADAWQRHLPDSARIFHFDASLETLDGIIQKLRYIDYTGETVKNAILILDPDIFGRISSYEHLYRQHPDLTPNPDFIQFHWSFFKVFMNRKFLSSYLELSYSGLQPDMLENGIFTAESPEYNPETNEESYPFYDHIITENIENYYNDRKSLFSRRSDTEIFAPTFDRNTIVKLETISDLLSINDTDYKIIIHPMYNYKTLTEKDMYSLQSIFGSDRVFNFSGRNHYTSDCTNYYDEKSHPRPEFCQRLLDIVYSR